MAQASTKESKEAPGVFVMKGSLGKNAIISADDYQRELVKQTVKRFESGDDCVAGWIMPPPSQEEYRVLAVKPNEFLWRAVAYKAAGVPKLKILSVHGNDIDKVYPGVTQEMFMSDPACVNALLDRESQERNATLYAKAFSLLDDVEEMRSFSFHEVLRNKETHFTVEVFGFTASIIEFDIPNLSTGMLITGHSASRTEHSKQADEIANLRQRSMWEEFINHRLRNYLSVLLMAIDANQMDGVLKTCKQMIFMHRIQCVRIGYTDIEPLGYVSICEIVETLFDSPPAKLEGAIVFSGNPVKIVNRQGVDIGAMWCMILADIAQNFKKYGCDCVITWDEAASSLVVRNSILREPRIKFSGGFGNVSAQKFGAMVDLDISFERKEDVYESCISGFSFVFQNERSGLIPVSLHSADVGKLPLVLILFEDSTTLVKLFSDLYPKFVMHFACVSKAYEFNSCLFLVKHWLNTTRLNVVLLMDEGIHKLNDSGHAVLWTGTELRDEIYADAFLCSFLRKHNATGRLVLISHSGDAVTDERPDAYFKKPASNSSIRATLASFATTAIGL